MSSVTLYIMYTMHISAYFLNPKSLTLYPQHCPGNPLHGLARFAAFLKLFLEFTIWISLSVKYDIQICQYQEWYAQNASFQILMLMFPE